jgi:mRNA-degrading endonuclease RelE of RelBE toxin-antitoxin system
MTHYAVSVSPLAAEKIADYGFYIATQSGSAAIAERWMARVYAAIEKLHYSPRRFVFAAESEYRDYDIHRLIIGKYLALYAVDDDAKIVRVIGFRHSHRLPRPDELPDAT